MKKDKKTAEFIRDKLVNLIDTEYNRFDASYEDHLILVNAIHDIYKLYTPYAHRAMLQEYLSNVIDQKHVMVNYPPKDDEFIQIKLNSINKFYMDLNDKFNNNDFTITYSKNTNLPPLINITFKLTDYYSITFSEDNVYITGGNYLISNDYNTNVPKNLMDKIKNLINEISREHDEKYYKTGNVMANINKAIDYIYHEMQWSNNGSVKNDR
jgi:hypothetical protein